MTRQEYLTACATAFDSGRPMFFIPEGTTPMRLVIVPEGKQLIPFVENQADVQDVVVAICKKYGYQSKVKNREFDDTNPVSESNPDVIDNPEPMDQFALRYWRQWAANLGTALRVELRDKELAKDAPEVTPIT